ncbi:MAG: dihydrodipicolinate synthase family protein [Candidatus Rokubacteria bacterium]|nr:dihydrodipicolinate synthase family protein [Candidatus Rokubacteria bacterium]MBI3826291.1 dihydrodipicolinate synthase family protein [Candidatus Rokubacteria bacterium]
MIDWSGVFHIMATPFADDGTLDEDGLPRLVECARASGVSGLTILGIAGEAHRLTDEERRRVVGAVVKEAAGRVPVAVGVSAPGTHLAAAFARTAREHGAAAVMIAPPAGTRNLEAVAEYYHAVADAARLPVVVQDEPVTTQVTMPAPFIARLCAELPAVEAVKLEEAPVPPKITRLRAALARRVPIFGGLGGVSFLEELGRGADGTMTGFAYPEALRAIREDFVVGRRAEARARFQRWLPLIRYESQPGSVPGTSIGIRKEILRRRGWIRSAYVRPPTPGLDAGTLEELDGLLGALGAELPLSPSRVIGG